MKPPSESTEPDIPQESLRARVAGAIERTCKTTARWSIPLLVPVGFLFCVYLVGGYVAISLGVWTPPYEFLSVSEDSYFAWLTFLVGLISCCWTGSLIGIAYLTSGEGRIYDELLILASFAGFGFGAGLLRMTYAAVLASVLQLF